MPSQKTSHTGPFCFEVMLGKVHWQLTRIVSYRLDSQIIAKVEKVLTLGSISTMHDNKHVRTTVPVIALLALSLFLRVWGNDFGLPFLYHIDEGFYVSWAVRLGRTIDFPSITHGPNLYHIVLFFFDALLYLSGRILGHWTTVDAFVKISIEEDPSTLYLIARTITALLGTGGCLLFTRLGPIIVIV